MIIGYIVLNIGLLVIILAARSELLRFLLTHNTIESHAVLVEFKKVARWNMYFALVYLASGMALIAWAVFLVIQYGLPAVILLLAFTIPNIVLSLHTKKLEERTKCLECSDPRIDTEYKRVCEVWAKQALPDF